MYTAVSSSPLSVGRSYKRSASSSQAAATRSAFVPSPRGVAGASGSQSYGSLRSAAEAGLTVNQLFASSSSSRRDVSSSPTTQAPAFVAASSAASVVVHGFACAPQQAATATAGVGATCTSPNTNLPPRTPALQQRGLLSKEMGCAQQEPATQQQQQRAQQVSLPTLHEVCGLHRVASLESWTGSGPHQWFPDVDCTLLSDLQERHPVFHSELVCMAYMLAARAHAGQMRRDGTSQLSHGALCALRLAELGLDAEVVAAGLLHEALRPAAPSGSPAATAAAAAGPSFRAQMEEFMPSGVVELVERVTTISEISHLYRHNKDALGEEKMRRLLLAMEDVRAMLVKLACRVHDMRTIDSLPRETQLAMAQETLDVFAVVANRLGVWSLKAELEDLAFSVLHPEEYHALKAQVSERQNTEALEATIQRVKASLDARGVRYEDISGRPKNLYGIWCKMRDNPDITSLDQVYDLTALRVVVANKHDCYVARRCIEELYRPMPERSKDFIRDQKKPNGYQSLHETIFGEGDMRMEVQIRTHKMHYIAEYGFAAHWKYKEKLSNEDEWLDKEVQYKKWLTTYKLNLRDNKVRAAGAPPRETALDSLGMHLLDAARAPLPAPLTSPSAAHRHSAHSATASYGLRNYTSGGGAVGGYATKEEGGVAAAVALRPAASAPSFTLHPPASSASLREQAGPYSGGLSISGGHQQGARELVGGVQQGRQEGQQDGPQGASRVDPFLQLDRFRLQAPAKRRVEFVLQTQDGIELRELPAGFPASRLSVELRLDRLPGYTVLVNQRPPAQGQEVRSGDLVQVVAQSAASLPGREQHVAGSAPAQPTSFMAKARAATACTSTSSSSRQPALAVSVASRPPSKIFNRAAGAGASPQQGLAGAMPAMFEPSSGLSFLGSSNVGSGSGIGGVEVAGGLPLSFGLASRRRMSMSMGAAGLLGGVSPAALVGAGLPAAGVLAGRKPQQQAAGTFKAAAEPAVCV